MRGTGQEKPEQEERVEEGEVEKWGGRKGCQGEEQKSCQEESRQGRKEQESGEKVQDQKST